jgi:hypothetical protein
MRMAEHPVSGAPTLCVHACSTRPFLAEALHSSHRSDPSVGARGLHRGADVASWQGRASDLRWLVAWLSLYGAPVGLSLPADLAFFLTGQC